MTVTKSAIPFFLYGLLFISIGWCASQSSQAEPALADMIKLQKIARASNGGAMGCGIGHYVYTSSRGETQQVQSGLDAIHVFGKDIHFETLDRFIRVRAAQQLDRYQHDFSDLFYVILSIYAQTGDPGSIEDILELNLDKNDVISRWAGLATAQILDKNPGLEQRIREFCELNGITLPAAQSPAQPE